MFSHIFEQLHSARQIQSPQCAYVPALAYPGPGNEGVSKSILGTRKTQSSEGPFPLRGRGCWHLCAALTKYCRGVRCTAGPCSATSPRCCSTADSVLFPAMSPFSLFSRLIFVPLFNDTIYNGASGEGRGEEACLVGSFQHLKWLLSYFLKDNLL